MKASSKIATCTLVAAIASAAAAADPEWMKSVGEALGKTGSAMPGDIYRVGLPRSDLNVTLDGVEVKPALALGSWLAFRKVGKDAMVMGDLVLLPTEVNPVMTKLEEGGIEVTALHNHLLRNEPFTMYMHVLGHGNPTKLATALHTALGETGSGKAAVTGDFVLIAKEVNPVLRALRDNGIEITAIHNHMLNDEPRLFFVHFWANDDVTKLTSGLKTALSKVNTRTKAATS